MGATHFRTLAIETGVLCNNRCVFCYQKGYRDLPGYPKLVPGEEVRSRMRWGLANGYDELSLTGGEPTVRPDFLDLVRYARELGYRRVAITTNGWRLARPEFFQEAVDAGLTSLGVSVHGPDGETHDAATNHPGSFERALQTIRNAVATYRTPRPVRLNTFTVVHRRNSARLPELAQVLYALGVRLMIFQPAILSKSNFQEAYTIAAELPEVVDAVRAVALKGIDTGFRAKLFNLPPCLFRDVLPGLDLDAYERATFREHDQARQGDRSGGDEVGYVRLEACGACVLRHACPGVHLTLLPQEDLAAHFEASIAQVSPYQHHQLWLAGTDLLRAAALHRVVRKARLAGFTDVRVTDGGSSVGGRAGMMAAQSAGASEWIFVHHPRDAASSDRILCGAGNDAFLYRAIADLATVPEGPMGTGLVASVGDEVLALLDRDETVPLARRGFTLHLRAPWRHTSRIGPGAGDLRDFLARLDRVQARPDRVVLQTPWPRLWEAALNLPVLAAAGLGRVRFDLTATVLPTSMLDPRHSILNWSLPRIGGRVLGPTGEPVHVPEIVSRGIRAQPVTREMLLRARTPYGAPRDFEAPRPPAPGGTGPTPARGP